ncbi:MAG TPA: hypothetical protein VGX23_16795 [Actinocrinis sp.]|nr:hypothetical protein [Actinocrinis sp.]
MAVSGQVPQFDPLSPAGRFPAGRTQPPAVRRAVMAMYVGAALSVVGAALSVYEARETGSGVVGVGTLDGLGIFGGAIDLGLWVWMALANRAGHNWARITGTVFFGITSLGTVFSVISLFALGDLNRSAGLHTDHGTEVGSVIFSVITWLVGLYATVMMWHKTASAFYQPQLQYGPVGWAPPGAAPYGYPGAGQYPYPYPGTHPAQYPYPYPYPYPNPADPAAGAAPQPEDPWQTPQDWTIRGDCGLRHIAR